MKEGQKLPLFGVGPYIVYGREVVARSVWRGIRRVQKTRKSMHTLEEEE